MGCCLPDVSEGPNSDWPKQLCCLTCRGYRECSSVGGCGCARCLRGESGPHRSEHILVAIPTVERTWQGPGCKEFKRIMLPLRLACAITIHKSQGMTIRSIILDPADVETHVGILFTGLSRVPSLQSLALARPVDFSRLASVFKSKAIAERKSWEASAWPPRQGKLEDFVRSKLLSLGVDNAANCTISAVASELARIRHWDDFSL